MSKLKNLSRYFYLLKRHWFGITSSFRELPDFIIIGAAKSGTTSLYYYFNKHPSIIESFKKEIGFFDDNFNLGLSWYRSWFPTIFVKNIISKKNGKCLIYEASPGYFQRPWAIERISNGLPNVKLILVLRNPVDRTFSHYQHSTRRGIKTKIPFKELLDRDFKKFENISSIDEEYFKKFVQNSYIGPSIYVKLIKEWLKFYSLEQLLIISTEELADEPNKILRKMFNFLQIEYYEIDTTERQNVGGNYCPMEPEIRQKLIDFFKPFNEELYKIINQRFDWDK